MCRTMLWMTVHTLAKASSNGLQFLSRMPARFKLVGELTRNDWTDEKFSPSWKATSYETKSYFGV